MPTVWKQSLPLVLQSLEVQREYSGWSDLVHNFFFGPNRVKLEAVLAVHKNTTIFANSACSNSNLMTPNVPFPSDRLARRLGVLACLGDVSLGQKAEKQIS